MNYNSESVLAFHFLKNRNMGNPQSKAQRIVVEDCEHIEVDARVAPIDEFYDRPSRNNVLGTRITKAPLAWLLGPKREYKIECNGEEWSAIVQWKKMTCMKPDKRTLYIDNSLEPTFATAEGESLELFQALIGAVNAQLPAWMAAETLLAQEEVDAEVRFANIEKHEDSDRLELAFARCDSDGDARTKIAKAPPLLLGCAGKHAFKVDDQEWKLVVSNSKKTHVDIGGRKVVLSTDQTSGYTLKYNAEVVAPVLSALNDALPAIVERNRERAELFDAFEQLSYADGEKVRIEFLVDNDAPQTKLVTCPAELLATKGVATFAVEGKAWTLVVDKRYMTHVDFAANKVVLDQTHHNGRSEGYDADTAATVVSALNAAIPTLIEDLRTSEERKQAFDALTTIEDKPHLEVMVLGDSVKISAMPQWLAKCNETFAFAFHDDVWTFESTKDALSKIVVEKRKIHINKLANQVAAEMPRSTLDELVATINECIPSWKAAYDGHIRNAHKRRLLALTENGPLLKRWKSSTVLSE